MNWRFLGHLLSVQALLLGACTPSSGESPAALPASAGGAGGNAGLGGAAGGTDVGVGGSGGDAGPTEQRFPDLGFAGTLAWLEDPDIWKPLPGQEGWDDACFYRAALPDRQRFPPLVWEPCGDGCERADVLQGYGTIAATPAISPAAMGTRAAPVLHFVQAKLPRNGTYSVSLQRSIDLASGETLAAVQQVMRTRDGLATCGVSAVTATSGLAHSMFRSRQDQLPSFALQGTWDPEQRAWNWQLPWLAIEDFGFQPTWCDTVGMQAGGRSFYLCGEVVRAQLTPGSSAISVLDEPGSAGWFVTGRGAALADLILWPEVAKTQSSSRVRAWRPDGNGLRTLVDGVPVDTCAVGLSDTHVAGFSTAGACSSYQPDGRLWVAERTSESTVGDVRVGPVFWKNPVTEFGSVATWGDFAAVVWLEQQYETRADRQRLLLARVSDWAMRDLRGPDGNEVWTAGLSDGYLYVVFTSGTGTPGQFTAVYRYALNRFDAIGTAIVPQVSGKRVRAAR